MPKACQIVPLWTSYCVELSSTLTIFFISANKIKSRRSPNPRPVVLRQKRNYLFLGDLHRKHVPDDEGIAIAPSPVCPAADQVDMARVFNGYVNVSEFPGHGNLSWTVVGSVAIRVHVQVAVIPERRELARSVTRGVA